MINTRNLNERPLQQIRAIIQERLKNISGIDDVSGIEIARLIQAIAHFYENNLENSEPGLGLSGQRWGILLRLLIEEDLGNTEGITPSRLSMFQNVQKNTISALLNGLEESGMIVRAADEKDKRFLRIRLTPQGKELALRITPKRLDYLNKLGSGLKESEREQLIRLLGKLFRSMIVNENNKSNSMRGNDEEE